MINQDVLAKVNEYTAGLDDDMKEEVDIDAFPEPPKSEKKRKSSIFDNLDMSKDIGSVHIPPTREQKRVERIRDLELEISSWKSEMIKEYERKGWIDKFMGKYDIEFMNDQKWIKLKGLKTESLYDDMFFCLGVKNKISYATEYGPIEQKFSLEEIENKEYSNDKRELIKARAREVSQEFAKYIIWILKKTRIKKGKIEKIFAERLSKTYLNFNPALLN